MLVRLLWKRFYNDVQNLWLWNSWLHCASIKNNYIDIWRVRVFPIFKTEMQQSRENDYKVNMLLPDPFDLVNVLLPGPLVSEWWICWYLATLIVSMNMLIPSYLVWVHMLITNYIVWVQMGYLVWVHMLIPSYLV